MKFLRFFQPEPYRRLQHTKELLQEILEPLELFKVWVILKIAVVHVNMTIIPVVRLDYFHVEEIVSIDYATCRERGGFQ